jgi:hypothetical protein
MIKTQMFIGVALIAGVAIGYFAKPERAPEIDDEMEEVVEALFSDRGEESSVAALRARVSELERQLAIRDGSPDDTQKIGVPGEGEPFGRGEGRKGPPTADEMRERFARMEKEDPVRFSQMTNHFSQMRQRRIDRAQARIDFLASVDTSRMSASAKKTHESLQDLIARREEIEEQMFRLDIDDDERRQIFQEMRETDQAMHELNMAERENLLSQMAEAIGLGADEAAEVNATIAEIIEATDFPRLPPLTRRGKNW